MKTTWWLGRTSLIARATFLEALRQRVFHLLALLAFVFVLGAQALREFNFGAPELKFLADCGFGAIAFFGSILTIVGTAQLFFSEIENRTALTLLSKPLRREEFIFGKLLGALAVVTVFCAVTTGLLMAVLATREATLLRDRADLLEGVQSVRMIDIAAIGFAHWLKFAVLASFTLLIGSYAQTTLFTVLVSSLVLMICHLQSFAQSAYARSDSLVLRLMTGGIELIFPDFEVFNLGDRVTRNGAVDLALLGSLSAYGLAYTVVVGALAAFSFKHREL